MATQLLSWSRDVLAVCRRPHGVAHFDLTVVLGSGGTAQLVRWKRLEPADLWRDDGPLLTGLPALRSAGGDVTVTATLFSWGEATHYALSRS